MAKRFSYQHTFKDIDYEKESAILNEIKKINKIRENVIYTVVSNIENIVATETAFPKFETALAGSNIEAPLTKEQQNIKKESTGIVAISTQITPSNIKGNRESVNLYESETINGDMPRESKTAVHYQYSYQHEETNNCKALGMVLKEELKKIYILKKKLLNDYLDNAIVTESMETIAMVICAFNMSSFEIDEVTESKMEDFIVSHRFDYLSLDDNFFEQVYYNNENKRGEVLAQFAEDLALVDRVLKGSNLLHITRFMSCLENKDKLKIINHENIIEVLKNASINEIAFFLRECSEQEDTQQKRRLFTQMLVQKQLEEQSQLKTRGYILYDDAKTLKLLMEDKPGLQHSLQEMFDVVTKNLNDAAKQSQFITWKYRFPRPYSDKISQLLRHIARLFFYQLKIQHSRLEEVQVMLVEELAEEKGNINRISLYISYSPTEIDNSCDGNIQRCSDGFSSKAFGARRRDQYNYRSDSYRRDSQRYPSGDINGDWRSGPSPVSSPVKSSVPNTLFLGNLDGSVLKFITEASDQGAIKFQKLGKQFNQNTKRAFHYSKQKLEKIERNDANETEIQEIFNILRDEANERSIHLIHPNDGLRHAEEYLCDIAEELRKSKPQSYWRFRIYGKKRPCMTCVGRMKASKIDMFNDRPGLVWEHCFKHQIGKIKQLPSDKKTIPAAIYSLRELFLTPSHITINNGKQYRDYDTDSESESE